MATDESKDHPSDSNETSGPEAGQDDTSSESKEKPEGSRVPATPASDDEGWPRSWIVIAAVLGIVAIIVVARLAGRTWRAELPPPEPPPELPAGPKPGPASRPADTEGKEVLVARDLSLPPGLSCIGKDSKAHPCKRGDELPAPCKIGVDGRSFRVEIERITAQTELLIWVRTAAKDPLLLYHAILLPKPSDEVPLWAASNQGAGMQVGIQLENMRKEPIKLKRVRFLLGH